MYNEDPLKTRPLTSTMINVLMDCHERELLKQPPIEAIAKGVKGLIARGFVDTGFYTDSHDKRSLCVYINEQGKKYLKEIISKN